MSNNVAIYPELDIVYELQYKQNQKDEWEFITRHADTDRCITTMLRLAERGYRWTGEPKAFAFRIAEINRKNHTIRDYAIRYV